MKTNATEQQLNKALEMTNKTFAGNIRFKRIEKQGNKMVFTLTVNDSKKPGARRGYSGQRVAAACWHVHGEFFDNLLEVNKDAEIRTAIGTINMDGGNWIDKNIGSIMQPRMYSKMCDC